MLRTLNVIEFTVYDIKIFTQDLNPGDSFSPLTLAIFSYVGASLSTICSVILMTTYLISK